MLGEGEERTPVPTPAEGSEIESVSVIFAGIEEVNVQDEDVAVG